MPTATPYYGSAAGNGFPFCLDRVNVADKGDGTPYDYWSTLGGFNKDSGGSPSANQINLSWQNAFRLYWMLYGVTGTAGVVAPASAITIDADNDLFSGGVEPIDRLCEDGYVLSKNDGAVTMTAIKAKFLNDVLGGTVRMYDGPTDNESNFVGYGIESKDDPSAPIMLGTHGISNDVFVRNASPSTTNGIRAIVNVISYAYNYTPLTGEKVDYAYTTFQGIPVLVQAFAASDETQTVDAANLSASITDSGDAFSATLDSIEFYNQ